MKRAMMVVFLGLSLAVLFQLGGNAHALEWVLYDDFESGVINTNKWNLDQSSANITVENGRAKFEHLAGHANDSAWLLIKKRPERITGIKATVRIVSGTGLLNARVGGFIGDYGDDKEAVWVVTAVNTRPEESGGDRIYSAASVLDRNLSYALINDLNYMQFWNPIDVIDEEFVIEVHFNETKYGGSVEGLGSGSFKFPEALQRGVDLQIGIGTRSGDAAGSGTVYFDDVYVLKERPADTVQPEVKSISPAYGAKNVPVNSPLIIKFKEPMKPQFFGESDPDYKPEPGVTWEYQYPSTFVFTGPEFDSGVWIENISYKKGWFQDAAGNPSKAFSFRFKTAP